MLGVLWVSFALCFVSQRCQIADFVSDALPGPPTWVSCYFRFSRPADGRHLELGVCILSAFLKRVSWVAQVYWHRFQLSEIASVSGSCSEEKWNAGNPLKGWKDWNLHVNTACWVLGDIPIFWTPLEKQVLIMNSRVHSSYSWRKKAFRENSPQRSMGIGTVLFGEFDIFESCVPPRFYSFKTFWRKTA